MKLKIYITSLLLIAVNSLFAQVGIGTTSPNASSMLDITSTNSGLLIPRVALVSASDVTTIASPITSLLVYNSGFAPNGYYYWNGSIWVQLSTGINSDWSLTGNSGTSAATNFFGTIDDVDIVFKRNNIRAGFIGNSNTTTGNMNTSFGASALNASSTGTRNTAIGANALFTNISGFTNVAIGERSLYLNNTGFSNVAVGVGALYSNAGGNSNTGIGRNALTANSSGDFNTSLGRDSMATNASGQQNTGVGSYSLFLNLSGNYNASFGVEALRNNSVGNNNVALGYRAGFKSLGSNNVFIGNIAGYNETGNEKLYIENALTANFATTNADNSLIYGDFSTDIVRVNGTLQISNPAAAPGYSLPIVRGTAGQVLQTDGVGSTAWTNSINNFSLMRSTLSTNQVLNSTSWQKITFDTVTFDVLGGEFNTGTNRFVPTKAGYYEVNAGFHTFNKSDSEQYAIAVYKNGTEYQETAAHHYGDKLISRIINCTIYLAVGDYVEIYIFNGNAPTTIDGYNGKTYFEVKQIR